MQSRKKIQNENINNNKGKSNLVPLYSSAIEGFKVKIHVGTELRSIKIKEFVVWISFVS